MQIAAPPPLPPKNTIEFEGYSWSRNEVVLRDRAGAAAMASLLAVLHTIEVTGFGGFAHSDQLRDGLSGSIRPRSVSLAVFVDYAWALSQCCCNRRPTATPKKSGPHFSSLSSLDDRNSKP
ncbi:hypothetical protein EVAR_87852_1 [Eumeta japonica]|uniref:Uncharacterized protein n=1 Tax=Eumeta variegata TaxID=151549 RepID=A0A4C1WV76_EUMVA|nr:hypothetical protein EVAR_87852_1 [Eumeta japonica]